MKNKRSEAIKKLTLSALLVSLAVVFGYVEHLIPFDFGIPGIKLGLANVAVIIVLYIISTERAFTVSVLRVIICFLLFGSIYSLAYSLVGGLVSLIIMCFMKKAKIFSVVGVSICGGIAHNIGQLIVAVFLVRNLSIALYLPVLLISGAITGAIIGLIATAVIHRINKNIVIE